MTIPATRANRQLYGAQYSQQRIRGELAPHQVYERPKKKYSQTFFVALFIGVASAVGFLGLFVSLLVGG